MVLSRRIANFKSDSDVTQAVKDTFSHDFTGNNFATIPKTVSIYQVNASDFSASTVLRQVTVRPSFFFQSLDKRPVQGYPSPDSLQLASTAASQHKALYVFGADQCRETDLSRCAGITANSVVFDTGLLVRNGNTADFDFNYFVKEENISIASPIVRRISNIVCTATKLKCTKYYNAAECMNTRTDVPTGGPPSDPNPRDRACKTIEGNIAGFGSPGTTCIEMDSTCTQNEDRWIETAAYQPPVSNLRLYMPPGAGDLPGLLSQLTLRFTSVGTGASASVDCPLGQLQRVPGSTTGISVVLANSTGCSPFSSDPTDTKKLSILDKSLPGIPWKEGVQITAWTGPPTQVATDRVHIPLQILSGVLRLR